MAAPWDKDIDTVMHNMEILKTEIEIMQKRAAKSEEARKTASKTADKFETMHNADTKRIQKLEKQIKVLTGQVSALERRLGRGR